MGLGPCWERKRVQRKVTAQVVKGREKMGGKGREGKGWINLGGEDFDGMEDVFGGDYRFVGKFKLE